MECYIFFSRYSGFFIIYNFYIMYFFFKILKLKIHTINLLTIIYIYHLYSSKLKLLFNIKLSLNNYYFQGFQETLCMLFLFQNKQLLAIKNSIYYLCNENLNDFHAANLNLPKICAVILFFVINYYIYLNFSHVQYFSNYQLYYAQYLLYIHF